jgi:segregation and condensation protein B
VRPGRLWPGDVHLTSAAAEADGSPEDAAPSAAGSLGAAETASGDLFPLDLAAAGASGVGEGSAPAAAVQPELDELGDPERLRSAVEAILLVVDTPTSSMLLAQVLGRAVPEVERALHALRDEYDAGGRGLDLREVADGWRLYSRDEFAAYVERFVLEGQQARLTQAALETLAVIAYRQPVTRSRISAIRGVSVDAVMRTLLTRGLVEECGADPDTGGGLYRTTPLFLEKMGLRSLDELPSLAPLLPDTSQLDDVELST